MYYNDPANGVTNQLPPNSDDILLDMNEPVIYFVQWASKIKYKQDHFR